MKKPSAVSHQPSAEDEEFAYRGICPHGKVRFLAADDPDMRNANAREIAKLIRAGYVVDRVTAAEARKSDFGCDGCGR